MPIGKKRPRSLRSLGLASLLVERYMRQGCLVRAVGRVRSKQRKRKKNTKSHLTLKKHTAKYIHSGPATATTSRRRAKKHVPRVSPYSYASSITSRVCGYRPRLYTHVCIYSHCCCGCAACVRFGALYYFLASAASSFSAVIPVCIVCFGVVRWCLTLSFP